MSDVDLDKNSGSDEGPDSGSELVRQQSWPVEGAAEIEVALEVGRIRVQLDTAPDSAPDSGAGEVRVEIRHDPDAGGGWAQGVSGFMNWLGDASATWSASGSGSGSGFPGFPDTRDFAAQAVRAAEISWSETGKRLVVRSSHDMPLRLVPLAVTVTAPAGSRLAARTGAGDLAVSGRAAWAALRTGSGGIEVAAVDGDVDVTTGSGDVDIREVSGRARIRTGSGTITLGSAAGPTDIKAGAGDVLVGTTAADLGARTGSGDIRITDAVAGQVEINTGTGDVAVAVHPGVLAEIDLSSGSGKARSELDVSTMAPGRPASLRVRGRTGTGDVLVTRASV